MEEGMDYQAISVVAICTERVEAKKLGTMIKVSEELVAICTERVEAKLESVYTPTLTAVAICTERVEAKIV